MSSYTPVEPRPSPHLRRARFRARAGVCLWVAGTAGCAVWWGWQTVWWHGLIVWPGYGLLLAAALVPRAQVKA